MNLASVLIALAVGTVIPALTALVSREHASAGLKALITACLSGASGVLIGYTVTPPHGTAQWEQVGVMVGLSWVAAVTSYVGAWQFNAAPTIQKATGRFGFGSKGPFVPPA